MILKIAIVVIPEALPHSIKEPFDVFSRCQAIYRQRAGQAHSHGSQVALVAESRDQTIELNGVRITPTHDIASGEVFDVVWIPSLMVDDYLSYGQCKKLQGWIKKQFEYGAEIATVCSGAFLLAETGLLNYREVALNKLYSYPFSDSYPLVNVKTHLPIHSGDRLYSAADDTDWITLATKILERKYCEVFSVKASEMFIFKGYKSRLEYRFPNQTQDAIVAKAQAWISDHISEDNLISLAAIQFGLRESSLDRRIKSSHRQSAISFVQDVRLQRAKEALKTTQLPVERICDLVGYRDSNYFRRLFKIKTGMTPNQYRNHCSTCE